jgi:homogentisate 1,2-dioxygenase
MGTRGFEGMQSIVYHHCAPTAILHAEDRGPIEIALEPAGALRRRHFRTRRLVPLGDFITGRQPLLHNNDVAISIVLPDAPMAVQSAGQARAYCYRNGQDDELVFVDQGESRIESLFGTLPFRRGDYLVIPIGTTYRLVTSRPAKLLVFETRGSIETLRRYRNEHGQLLEHSPCCERDIRVPQELASHDEAGEFAVLVRATD